MTSSYSCRGGERVSAKDCQPLVDPHKARRAPAVVVPRGGGGDKAAAPRRGVDRPDRLAVRAVRPCAPRRWKPSGRPRVAWPGPTLAQGGAKSRGEGPDAPFDASGR